MVSVWRQSREPSVPSRKRRLRASGRLASHGPACLSSGREGGDDGFLDGRLYVFNVESGPDPDLAITYVLTDPRVRRGEEVTEEDVRANRLRYDPELLVGYLRRAQDAELMKKTSPELYADYSVRTANYTSESDWAITTVQTIHRFEKQDIMVLQGTVQNKLSKPLIFDGRSTTVQVVQEVHPAKLTDVAQPIPAGHTVPISVVLQGDWDGAERTFP